MSKTIVVLLAFVLSIFFLSINQAHSLDNPDDSVSVSETMKFQGTWEGDSENPFSTTSSNFITVKLKVDVDKSSGLSAHVIYEWGPWRRTPGGSSSLQANFWKKEGIVYMTLTTTRSKTTMDYRLNSDHELIGLSRSARDYKQILKRCK
jgi:hypothetical protein